MLCLHLKEGTRNTNQTFLDRIQPNKHGKVFPCSPEHNFHWILAMLVHLQLLILNLDWMRQDKRLAQSIGSDSGGGGCGGVKTLRFQKELSIVSNISININTSTIIHSICSQCWCLNSKSATNCSVFSTAHLTWVDRGTLHLRVVGGIWPVRDLCRQIQWPIAHRRKGCKILGCI